MKIETIRLKNYRAFKSLELANLSALVIFVGANGTGKSTLFDVFGFLRDALTHNVTQALAKRGGFREVRSREADGAIEIELQFRLQIVGKDRLVTYHLEVDEKSGAPHVKREFLSYKRGAYGSPYHFLDFKDGHGMAVTNEEDFGKTEEELPREKQHLGSPDILAIKGLGQFERFKAASAFRQFIENWHVSDFHISEARPSREAGHAEHLSPTGDNLPLVAQFMFEKHREVFDRVLEKLHERVPGVARVEAKNTEDGRIILKFQDGAFRDPFIARHVSDGTIKMFAYLVLLNEPKAHPLLCIEEPENQLYPMLLHELQDEFREYAQRGGQVFVTTHSPDFLNGTSPQEVYWLHKADGYTSVHHASDVPELVAMCEAGEQLGYLWKQDFFTHGAKK